MRVVNFSRYSLSLRAVRNTLKEIAFSLALFGVAVALVFYMVILPAHRLVKIAQLNGILQSRCNFIEKLLVKLETRRQYWMGYYNHFLRRRFSNVWNDIWTFLEESLPENAWIDEIEWRKFSDGGYRLIVKGEALLNGENIDNFVRCLNEMSVKVKGSIVSDYIDKVVVEEVKVDSERKVLSYVVEFYPKSIFLG